MRGFVRGSVSGTVRCKGVWGEGLSTELLGVRGSAKGSVSGNLNCEGVCDNCERDVRRKGNVRRNEVRKYGVSRQ